MKITAVTTVVVNAQMRNWVFVKVSTDEGVVGWGEASLEWKTRAVCGAVADLEPLIVGQHPARIEHLFQIMYRHPFFRAGIEGMGHRRLSARGEPRRPVSPAPRRAAGPRPARRSAG